ncbi:hypothetical protein RFI_05480 [Reticulomyxa filosa]|uniref:Uncharacterized protein n=1 Tax=Reticulomyxa filosa TaxID=46433 RepID=X6P066_RETFI|nr:hypothetical protein RFI_05480 [Reticulomyxa filosa]|eukprot:ETO31636.1 hypothetical protein RFI_05480 [Reticulomyxa filosa]
MIDGGRDVTHFEHELQTLKSQLETTQNELQTLKSQLETTQNELQKAKEDLAKVICFLFFLQHTYVHILLEEEKTGELNKLKLNAEIDVGAFLFFFFFFFLYLQKKDEELKQFNNELKQVKKELEEEVGLLFVCLCVFSFEPYIYIYIFMYAYSYIEKTQITPKKIALCNGVYVHFALLCEGKKSLYVYMSGKKKKYVQIAKLLRWKLQRK